MPFSLLYEHVYISFTPWEIILHEIAQRTIPPRLEISECLGKTLNESTSLLPFVNEHCDLHVFCYRHTHEYSPNSIPN